MNPRRIDDTLSVAPQIAPEDIPMLAEAGFAWVINNRPEGEEPGQPSGASIRAAAEAAGLGYAEIPVVMGGMSSEQVEAMAEALGGANGPVLAFCRSGTRSCNLWALASASQDGDPTEIVAKAAAAGYDLSAIRPLLDRLAHGA